MTGPQLDFFSRLLGRVLPKRSAPSEAPLSPKQAPISAKADAELTARCVDLLAPLHCEDLARRVRVSWSGRLHSTAGVAYPGKSLIKLNPRLREFGDAEIDRTLRHELAHLLAHFRVGRRRISPHGPEWRKACVDLGLADETRCHSLPLPRRQMARPHLYRCPSCAAEIRRVRPMRRASACLSCCRRHSQGRYDERFRFQRVRQAR